MRRTQPESSWWPGCHYFLCSSWPWYHDLVKQKNDWKYSNFLSFLIPAKLSQSIWLGNAKICISFVITWSPFFLLIEKVMHFRVQKWMSNQNLESKLEFGSKFKYFMRCCGYIELSEICMTLTELGGRSVFQIKPYNYP